jgi:hypothetical protein
MEHSLAHRFIRTANYLEIVDIRILSRCWLRCLRSIRPHFGKGFDHSCW